VLRRVWARHFERARVGSGDGTTGGQQGAAACGCGRCRACPSRARCTRSRPKYRRVLAVMPRPEHEALAATRAREGTAEGKRLYAQRQGVEGAPCRKPCAPLACAGRATAACRKRASSTSPPPRPSDLDRIAAWFAGRPLAPTRTSRFAALAAYGSLRQQINRARGAHHHGEEMGHRIVGRQVTFHLRLRWPYGGRRILDVSTSPNRSVRAVFRHHPLSPPALASTISSI